ncbi:potassium channel subfamily K member 2-like [Mytilus edulis]|uniref:potassium channel subfamily K member 2-like n=1 Tax=Mytilus edulis TaxID=6550 RepID=UPI0039EF6F50
MEHKTLLILVMVVMIYSLICAAVMMVLEKRNEETSASDVLSTINTFLSDHSSCMTKVELQVFLNKIKDSFDSGIMSPNGTAKPPQWDFESCIFYTMTVLTTIGYGNQTPVTKEGRVFTVIFATIGIPVAGLMMVGVAERMKRLTKRIENKKLPCLKTHSTIENILKTILIHVTMITLLVLIPSIIFRVVEGWSYGDGIYYSFITLTTIGFGDYVVGINDDRAGKHVYKFLVVVWIIFGLSWVGAFIGDTTEKYKKFTERKENENRQVGDGNPKEMKEKNTKEGTSTDFNLGAFKIN